MNIEPSVIQESVNRPCLFRFINLGFNTIPNNSRIKVGMKNITP